MKLTADELQTRIRPLGVMPVVTVAGESDGLALADALIAGGLPAIELTLRVEGAMEALRAVARARPQMLVGAGTVRSATQAAESVAAGAAFLVSPGFVPEVAAYAAKQNICYLPGTGTPTEMETARAAGLSFLKLFPAEVVGGRGMLSAVNAAMPDFSFVPTGGITLDSMPAYLALPNVVAVGGSWIASGKDIAARNWDGIRANAQAAVARAVQSR
jgi:2-dehydro-3-deoxyphosphogluconate aldolase / (4S)-4-hydroxy-2-oxoglutarate aldolase